MSNLPHAEYLRELVVALCRTGTAHQNSGSHRSAIHVMRIVQAYIKAHISDPLQQAVISSCCAMSPSHFSRMFHQATGTSFSQFVLQKRIERSSELLQTSEHRIKEIAYSVGFHDTAYFTRVFRKHVGTSPNKYRQMHLHTGTEPCPVKATQATLQENKEHVRSLLDGVRDYAIFMLDAQGRVQSWNAGAERIKGYTAKEIIGQHFSCFYPPEAVAAGHPQRVLEVAKHEGRYEEQGPRVRKDGSRFLANVVINTVYDAQGRLCGFAMITRDITKRKRHTQALFGWILSLAIYHCHERFELFFSPLAVLAFT
jgi:PAS domain S-box-containing protein